MPALVTLLSVGAGLVVLLTTMTAWLFRRFHVLVNPDEFVVHYRNGRLLHVGRGKSFLCLPWDTYLKVPGTLRDVNFCADQITIERQGVRVQGFLAYKIEDFDKAYQALDFRSRQVKLLPACEENVKVNNYADKTACKIVNLDPSDPLAKTDVVLRQLAESVVRHEVSNKTLQQMISEREKVRESMRKQLMETVTDWGISIDTIEFTEVWIRSKEVFENLQAQYRNEIRLKAETSTFETTQSVAQKRLEAQRQIAQMEAETERSRRVSLSHAQVEASKVEIENKRQNTERQIDAEAALKEQDRVKKHEAQLREAELAHQRELAEKANRLAAQEREHQVAMDARAKIEALKLREEETARQVAQAEAQRQIEQAELERQKAEVVRKAKLEAEQTEAQLVLVQEQASADAVRLAAEGEAGKIAQLASAHKREALEDAEGIAARGRSQAESIALKIKAENEVNLRQIQRQLVDSLSGMAAQMKVNDVNWINITGNGEESPLGIIPRNVLQILSVFKGLGLGLEDVIGGKAGANGATGHDGTSGAGGSSPAGALPSGGSKID